MIRIDEINKDIKTEEEFGATINVSRSKSISSVNSSMALDDNSKINVLDNKIRERNDSQYKKADFNLSKPVLLQNKGKKSRYTTYNNPIGGLNDDKKLKAKNEMNVIPEVVDEGKENDLNNDINKKKDQRQFSFI
jgi:hypothetical protein